MRLRYRIAFSLTFPPHPFFFLAPEARRGEPEEMVVIVWVDARREGVDKFSAVAVSI